MRTFFSHFGMTKSQRSGFFVLIFLILLSQGLIWWINRSDFETEETEIDVSQIQEWQTQIDAQKENSNQKYNETSSPIKLQKFNPDTLSLEGWKRLGFSDKQSQSLIKYRDNYLKGHFNSKEEVKNAYVISDEKFKELESYIVISTVKNSNQNRDYSFPDPNQAKIRLKPFDANQLDHSGWVKLGFSDKQATSILNYKNKACKGHFTSKEQIAKCFVISDWKFNQIESYIIIRPEKEKPKALQKHNPNQMTKADWQTWGFTAEEAENIVKYKEFIGGFKNAEDVKNCQFISPEKFEAIKKYIQF